MRTLSKIAMHADTEMCSNAFPVSGCDVWLTLRCTHVHAVRNRDAHTCMHTVYEVSLRAYTCNLMHELV